MNDLIQVIHIRNFKPEDNYNYYFYIGRKSGLKKEYTNLENIELGNPFSVQQYGRGVCIEKYREYARKQYKDNNIEFKNKINRIVNKAKEFYLLNDNRKVFLVCFCHPSPCHGDLIKQAVIKELEKALVS